MAVIDLLPQRVDVDLVAGNPLTINVAVTGTTVSLPTVSFLTEARDRSAAAIVATQVGNVVTVMLSAEQTTALNTTRRTVRYWFSLRCSCAGAGPYELCAGQIRVHPIGSSSTPDTDPDVELTVTVGGVNIDLAVPVPIPSPLIVDGGRPDEVYGGGLPSIDGGLYSDTFTTTTYDGGTP